MWAGSATGKHPATEAISEADWSHNNSLSAVDVFRRNIEEIVVIFLVERTIGWRTGDDSDIPITDGGLPFPALCAKILQEGIDTIAIGVCCRIKAITTPAIKGALYVRRLVGAIAVHVHVNLNAGKATDGLRFATGPPLVGGTARIAIEAACAGVRTTIRIDDRGFWFTAGATTTLSMRVRRPRLPQHPQRS